MTSTDSAYLVGNTTGRHPDGGDVPHPVERGQPLPGVSNLNLSPNAIRAVSTYAPLLFTSVDPS